MDALVGFVGCVGLSIPDICSYGLTVGDHYVPFNPDEDDDCEDDEQSVACSQIWVRVDKITPTAVTENFAGSDCTSVLSIGLEVGVLRCFGIEEGGEAPSATDVMEASLQTVSDCLAIQCAALGCEVWESIVVGSWAPLGPLGGQYGGYWTFTVEL